MTPVQGLQVQLNVQNHYNKEHTGNIRECVYVISVVCVHDFDWMT